MNEYEIYLTSGVTFKVKSPASLDDFTNAIFKGDVMIFDDSCVVTKYVNFIQKL